MFLDSPIAIPTAWQSRYRVLRVLLYCVIASVTIFFALRVLFPTLIQSFDFRAPGSSKNAILFPRSTENLPRTNGKIEQNGIMKADTAVIGDFSLIQATAVLEKDSALPETLPFTLRRSYQSFFYPTGDPVTDFPKESLYRVADTYYALRNGTLYPFVSDAAYLSRFEEKHALAADASLLSNYPISEEWLGFRVGSLLSNATGVFVVTSEGEMRPVGSAEIFLALGYDFADVIPVSEEELGAYKRGRIFLLGAAHPDGTLLFDQDTATYYIIGREQKHPLLPGAYRDFLIRDKHPILVSTKASERSVSCALVPNLFGTNLSCATMITTLAPGLGNDFELTLTSPETDIDINSLTISFETAKNRQNMMTLLSQIKQRLLSRFGGVQ
ncbi:MAG: hypothetical protein WA082_02220 [Candidatus Moraniibacteriota bacterium]